MILAWLRRFNCLEAGLASVVSYNNLLVLEYELAPILTMLTIWCYTGMCMIYFLL